MYNLCTKNISHVEWTNNICTYHSHVCKGYRCVHKMYKHFIYSYVILMYLYSNVCLYSKSSEEVNFSAVPHPFSDESCLPMLQHVHIHVHTLHVHVHTWACSYIVHGYYWLFAYITTSYAHLYCPWNRDVLCYCTGISCLVHTGFSKGYSSYSRATGGVSFPVVFSPFSVQTLINTIYPCTNTDKQCSYMVLKKCYRKAYTSSSPTVWAISLAETCMYQTIDSCMIA